MVPTLDLDQRRLRDVLGHYPTGVVVVAAVHEGRPVGLTVGSFTSVSLDPALVGFLPAKSSSSWPLVRAAGVFCVSVLGAAQGSVSAAMAAGGVDKFAGVDWTPGRFGAPRISDAVAWIECELADVAEAGDHWFVTARILEATVRDCDTSPLIFHRGAYR